MSITARTPTTLDTNKFIPEIFANNLVDALHSKLVALDAIDHSWESNLSKGDTLYITKSNTVTATEVTVGSKASATNPFNTGAVTLSINQFWEAPVDLDTMSNRQTQVQLEAKALIEALYAVKKKVDSTVCDLFSSLGGYSSSAYGSDGQTCSDDILIYLMETLDEADVPDESGDRSLMIDPSAMADLLKYDKFTQNIYVGNTDAVKNGKIGGNHPIYKCQIRQTNNLTAATTGNYACMLHKTALTGAIQITPANTWMHWYKELHQVRFQSEALWGVVELNDERGIPFYTRKS
jgi:hypothetical protein